MNGLIFAAGLGTRLAPLTATTPKALISVGGQPLLARAVAHLADSGIRDIVVNVHHFADQIEDYIAQNKSKWHCDIVISDERKQLMETGGGLAQALPLFGNNDDIVILNADILTNVRLAEIMSAHKKGVADATLLTSPRHSTRSLLFDNGGRLTGWRNEKTGETKIVRAGETNPTSFNGVHVVRQSLAKELLPARPMSIIEAYLQLAGQAQIMSHESKGYYWFDIGTMDKLSVARRFALLNKL